VADMIQYSPPNLVLRHHRARLLKVRALRIDHRDIAAQVEIESENSNLYAKFQFQALEPGASTTGFNTVQHALPYREHPRAQHDDNAEPDRRCTGPPHRFPIWLDAWY